MWGVYNKDGNDFDFAVNTTPSYALPDSAHESFTYGDTWNHVCWVFDGANKKSYYYINGVLADDKTINNENANSSTSMANDLNVLVGCGYSFDSNNPNCFFEGEIDDVHFYKSALTAQQVSNDMNSFDATTAQTLSLVAAYDFANIEGTTIPDISGNGHTGTLHGYSVGGNETEEKYKTPEGSMDLEGKAYVKTITSEGTDNKVALSQLIWSPIRQVPDPPLLSIKTCATAKSMSLPTGIATVDLLKRARQLAFMLHKQTKTPTTDWQITIP